MRVLAVDTASPAPSLALLDTGSGRRHLAVDEGLPQGAAEALVSRLTALLERCGAPLDSIDRIAILSGPGSFTGLRAGTAFARGLARALGVPLVGIPTFEAASAACPEAGDADLLLDAGRGEVHQARRRRGRLGESTRPLPREEALAEASRARVPAVDLDTVRLPLALSLARLGAVAETSEPAPGPRYGRPSAAEEKLPLR